MRSSLLLIALLLGCPPLLRAQTSYSWNGSAGTAWNQPANWTPTGTPGPADNVSIALAGAILVLDAPRTVASLDLRTGTLDLGGFALTITANAAFGAQNYYPEFAAGCLVSNGTLRMDAGQNVTFGHYGYNHWMFFKSVINATVQMRTQNVVFHGTDFGAPVSLIKTGMYDNNSNGGCVFNGAVALRNEGAGYLGTAFYQPDVYQQRLDIYAAVGRIHLACYNSVGNQFNGDVTFSSPAGGGGVNFGTAFGTNMCVLAAGKQLRIGPDGHVGGLLQLINFRQLGGTTPITLENVGAAVVAFSTFGSDFTLSTGWHSIDNSTFRARATISTYGAGDRGGNTFEGPTRYTLLASSGNTSALTYLNPNVYKSQVTFACPNGGSLIVTNGGPDLPATPMETLFNEDVTFDCKNGGSVQLSYSNTRVKLAAGKRLLVAPGFDGTLALSRLQQVGNTPQSLTLSNNSMLVIGGVDSYFEGAVNFRAPIILFAGCRYEAAANFEQTQGGNVHWPGLSSVADDEFKGETSFAHSGPDWWNLTRYGNRLLFRRDVTITNSGTGMIFCEHPVADVIRLEGNLRINLTGGGKIRLNHSWWGDLLSSMPSGGTATLAAGRNIATGSSGITGGEFIFCGLRQLGTTPQNLGLSGGALRMEGNSFEALVSLKAPQLLISYCRFAQLTTLTKMPGGWGTFGKGGNLFRRRVQFINQDSQPATQASEVANTLTD